MTTLVVTGAQWGDEGKGKVVDVLAADADVVARFSGGNNAGHTLVVGGRPIVTHLVPSGCLYPETLCVLGAGMVLDLDVLRGEVEALRAHGLLSDDRLRVSLDAHVIWPFHRELDGRREDAARGKSAAIGTTRRGIGPAYEAKAGRRGIRIRDLFRPERLRERLLHNQDLLGPELGRLGAAEKFDVDALLARGEGWAKLVEPWVADTGATVHEAIMAGRRVLFEGAQGALLDVDHGTYPFVTSTSTTAGGVCAGFGIGPTLIDEVWGITKAYTTRVGAGPMPTRLDGPEGEALRQAGSEFGATTGRPRDCGWLDLPALRYAARINGYSGLCMTKLDVLVQLPEVRVCTAYRDGQVLGRDSLDEVEPVFEQVPDLADPDLVPRIRRARSVEDLPAPVRRYLDLVADQVGVPIVLLSTGADRAETLVLRAAFTSS